MALATQDDVEARLGRPLSDTEAEKLESLLSDASALLIGYTGQDFEPAPYPGAVVGVVARMVARSLAAGDRAPGMQSETRGPFSWTFAADSSGAELWLTKADKVMLRPYRSGLSSVQFYSERYTETVDTPPAMP